MNIQAINSYNAIQSLGVNKKQPNVAIQDNKKTPIDSFEISEESRLLAEFNKTFLNGAGEDGVITMDEIKSAANHYKSESQKRLNGIMDQLGIGPGVSFSLSHNMQGKIAVNGDFEGKDKLEEALNNDETFRNNFGAFSGAARLLAAAEAHEEFRKAYEADPIAAVEKYRQHLNGNVTYSVSMSYNAGIYDSAVAQKVNGYSFS